MTQRIPQSFRSSLSALFLFFAALCPGAAEETNGPGYHAAYYLAEELNPGLPQPGDAINRATPQALLEFMIRASRSDDYERAAHGLNLRLIPRDRQANQGPSLARHLCYLIRNKLSIPWSDIPDRPDGQLDVASGARDHLLGKPRRSIRIGEIPLDGRDLPFRIQRVKAGDANPVWVFAPSTVENIPKLYERFGPGLVERILPPWSRARLLGELALWQIFFLAGLLLIGAGLGWIAQWITVRLVRRAEKSWTWAMAELLPGPVGLLSGLLAFYLLKVSLVNYTGPVVSLLNPVLLAIIVFAFTWLGTRIIHFFSDYMTRKYVDELQNFGSPKSRHMLTTIDVGRRVLVFLALLVGLGFALSQFHLFKVVGMSLLASAGVFSVVIGVAAQSLLGNLIGGMQIAITQPVSIGDSVRFEGTWGYVEEIAYTYITIRTWDQRRLVVPLRYFLTHPVENWSMKDAHLIKPIHFYVDYAADIEPIRKKFDELVRNAEEWDETAAPTVEVTAVTERTIEVRALCSAKNPITAWVLHCRLREEMLEFLREWDEGRYLPRERIALNGDFPHRENSGDGNSGGEEAKGRKRPSAQAGGKRRTIPREEAAPEEA
jgi:small-conductance mechanosensitive channel